MRICLTVDIEWAPEFVIDWMAERVKKAGVPATWFATHDSGVLKSMAKDPGQEIGLHPNFLPGSTQGKDAESIIKNLKELYPGALGVRAHALLDSTYHQKQYKKYGLDYVSSTLIWQKPSEPFFAPWTGMWHIPISWEDDVACGAVKDLSVRSFKDKDDALWVFNFHPLYCYLNEKPGMKAYRRLKNRYKDLHEIPEPDLDSFRQTGEGLEAALDSILKKKDAHRFLTLKSVLDDVLGKPHKRQAKK